VTHRDEPFVDLPLDIEQNSSVSSCLRNFSRTETLTARNKFFCEACHSLQEAQKRMCLRRLPRVLTLHLKRFKYLEAIQNFSKLSHRVVFPLQLRMPNMARDAAADADACLYRLFAVVVHIGRGMNHGHYVAAVKSADRWVLFDDDLVEAIDEGVLQQLFGLSNNTGGSTTTGYLLFYEREQ
jgi:ubiquitin carboxyl-terminal hydrolase 12/46